MLRFVSLRLGRSFWLQVLFFSAPAWLVRSWLKGLGRMQTLASTQNNTGLRMQPSAILSGDCRIMMAKPFMAGFSGWDLLRWGWSCEGALCSAKRV